MDAAGPSFSKSVVSVGGWDNVKSLVRQSSENESEFDSAGSFNNILSCLTYITSEFIVNI